MSSLDLDVPRARTRGPARKDLQTEIETEKPRQRPRGVPPHPDFDIDELPGSTRLTETETAGVVRRSNACLESWRKNPDHPLKWRNVGGRILYRLSHIREFLGDDERGRNDARQLRTASDDRSPAAVSDARRQRQPAPRMRAPRKPAART